MARALLGMLLVRELPEGTVAVRIDEVEAYLGVGDPAAHTFGGRRTPRNRTMWGEAGHLYVYFVYGMHHCCNVVTEGLDTPTAVLLRGGRAAWGEEILEARRGGRHGAGLANGPGKLCAALGIDRSLDGADLATRGPVWLADDGTRVPAAAIAAGPRVGVDYAGEASGWPLRFRVTGAEPRRAGPRPTGGRRAERRRS